MDTTAASVAGKANWKHCADACAELEVMERERAASEARLGPSYESSHDADHVAEEQGFFDCNARTWNCFALRPKRASPRCIPQTYRPPCQPGWPGLPVRGERDDTDCLPAWFPPLRMDSTDEQTAGISGGCAAHGLRVGRGKGPASHRAAISPTVRGQRPPFGRATRLLGLSQIRYRLLSDIGQALWARLDMQGLFG